MGTLRDQMLVDLQLSGAKPSTQRTYLREAENLAKYFHKSPEQLGENELKAYLLHLMKERHLSEGTFRYKESQAQGHPDDDVFFGIESERNSTP
jgi:integrase/recombinase XerD